MQQRTFPRIGRRYLAAGLVLVALIAAAFGPTILWLGRTWWVDPYYTHGPLAVAAAAYFTWRARDAFVDRAPSMIGVGMIAAGLALRISTFARADHVVASAGLLFVLAGFAAIIGGRHGLRAAALPVAILALAVPLPQIARIAPPLAAHAAGIAAGAAGLIGVEVARSGAQLVVADGAMTVGAPCSGLRSLVALVTLAVVLAGVLDGPISRRALIVLAAVPIALFANGARLVGLIWVAAAMGLDRGLSFFHGPSSAMFFMASVAGLIVFGRTLGCDFGHALEADELG